MRDRLIELIRESNCVDIWDYYNDDFKKPNPIEQLADYLLANGVIVPPCKVGDTVYYPSASSDRIFEKKVDEILMSEIENDKGFYIHIAGCYIPFENIGKTIFLTKEEAEKALKGGEG